MRSIVLLAVLALTACEGGKADTADTDLGETDVVDTDTDLDTDVTDTEIVDCSAIGTPDHASETDVECRDCCVSEHPTEYAKVLGFVQDECACGDSAPCAEACTAEGHDVCTGGTPSTECTTCLDTTFGNGHDCVEAAIATCSGDPTCAPLFTCVESCPSGE